MNAFETQEIGLQGLAPAFDGEDKRCVYLIDHTGNAEVFFKYKATRHIDVASLMLEVSISKKSKEEAVEEIRKGLVYGMHAGGPVIFHCGEMNLDVNEFLKGQPFWDPKQLFQPPNKMSQEWFRSKIMKPTDKDSFGNEGSLFAKDNYILFLSLKK